MRQRPGSDAEIPDSQRCSSDHSDTVRCGSGFIPRRQARRMLSAPSKDPPTGPRVSISAGEIDADIGEAVEVCADMVLKDSLDDGGVDCDLLFQLL